MGSIINTPDFFGVSTFSVFVESGAVAELVSWALVGCAQNVNAVMSNPAMRFLTKREVCNLLSDTASGFDVVIFFMCVVIIDKKIFLVPSGVFFVLCLCFCRVFCFAKITDM